MPIENAAKPKRIRYRIKIRVKNHGTVPLHWNVAGGMDYLKGREVMAREKYGTYAVRNTNKDFERYEEWWLNPEDVEVLGRS